MAGLLMCAAGVWALLTTSAQVVIYAPPTQRIAGRAHRARPAQPAVRHHADYAAATNTSSAASTELGFARAPHALLDTRLMMAWASHLAAHGEVDRARWLAQRLREFRNPEADSFFAPCEGGAKVLFQCQAPLTAHGWREFGRARGRRDGANAGAASGSVGATTGLGQHAVGQPVTRLAAALLD